MHVTLVTSSFVEDLLYVGKASVGAPQAVRHWQEANHDSVSNQGHGTRLRFG